MLAQKNKYILCFRILAVVCLALVQDDGQLDFQVFDLRQELCSWIRCICHVMPCVANVDIASTVRTKALSKAEQVQLQRLLAGVHDKLEDSQGLPEIERKNRTATGS